MAEPSESISPPRPRVLERVHAVDGRVRLRLRNAASREEFQALAEQLSGLAGVTNIVARPNTRSVILSFDGKAEDMMARLAEARDIRVADRPKPVPLSQLSQLGMLQLDQNIKKHTDDVLDFRTGVALFLVFGAIVQLGRGRIAGPTTTLLMSALSLLNAPKGK